MDRADAVEPEALRHRWKEFLNLALDPWSVLLLICVGMLVWLSTEQTAKPLAAVFSLLASVAAGVFGGQMRQRSYARREREVLVARGRSAIRNLRLLLNSVRSLEARAGSCLASAGKGDGANGGLLYHGLEEVVDKCSTIHEEGINAIENWIDIIPEADVTTQIGKIRDLQQRIRDTEDELERLKGESQKAEASQKEVRVIAAKLAATEHDLREAKSELASRRSSLSEIALSTTVGSPVFGAFGSSPPSWLEADKEWKCSKCGDTVRGIMCHKCNIVCLRT
jgi:hypothetical protein